MLIPKRMKYRKQQRGRMTGKAWRGAKISFGDFGLKVLEPGWITDRQIEASRVAMTRFVKRGGKIWIRVFPDKPVTRNLLKPVWEKAKARLNTGSLSSPGQDPVRDGRRDARKPVRPCGLHRTNWRCVRLLVKRETAH